jgi:phage terminase large subunit-like protein
MISNHLVSNTINQNMFNKALRFIMHRHEFSAGYEPNSAANRLMSAAYSAPLLSNFIYFIGKYPINNEFYYMKMCNFDYYIGNDPINRSNFYKMEFQEAIHNYAEQPITKQLLLDLLKDYKRPYDKITELVKQGLLVLVRRGVYTPGPNLHIATPESFLLANHLLGPSYVSLETALSHWGLIPEKVYETTSVTTQKTAVYKTPAGRFSYVHLPSPYYSFGITRVELTKKQTVLMATPEKALCDKIVTTSGLLLRSTKQAKELLMEDLRIEKAALRNLNHHEIGRWITDAPKKGSLEILTKTLAEL